MCFSAEASFVAAAAVGSVGVVGLRSVREPRDLVLATLPLAFAVHQAAEGVTWRLLAASGQGTCTGASVVAWVVFAWALVPVWLALGITLVERDARRARTMWALVVVGLVTMPVWLWQALSAQVYARPLAGHLEYPLPSPDVSWLIPAYLLVALLPPLLSSHPWLRRLGLAGLGSAVVMLAVSLLAWPSLWCFAAAVASVLIVAHLRSLSPSGDRHEVPSPRRVGSPRTEDAP